MHGTECTRSYRREINYLKVYFLTGTFSTSPNGVDGGWRPLPPNLRYCTEPTLGSKYDKTDTLSLKYLFCCKQGGEKNHTNTQTLQTVNRGLFYFELGLLIYAFQVLQKNYISLHNTIWNLFLFHFFLVKMFKVNKNFRYCIKHSEH